MGAKIDAAITNPDMAVHLEEYPIESLEPPVFLIHAQDDRVVPFAQREGMCRVLCTDTRISPHVSSKRVVI